MLIAALALLLTQETYVGALYALEVPMERLAVQESANERFYVLEVVDPEARDVPFPPLRVTFLKETFRNEQGAFREGVQADTIRALKEMGATVGEVQQVQRRTKDCFDYTQWVAVTDVAGRKLRFEFFNLYHGNHVAVATLCMPEDEESQRHIDVLAMLPTLEFRGLDLEHPMHFDLLGVQFSLPLQFSVLQQQNEQGGVLEAHCEGILIRARVVRTDSAEAAAAWAADTRPELAEQVKQAVENEKLDYTVHESLPTWHGINGRGVYGQRTEIHGRGGAPDGWRLDWLLPIGDTACLLTAVVRETAPIEPMLARVEQMLQTVRGAEIPGNDQILIEDGLYFRHDAGLERRRVETEHGPRWEFRRRGLEHAVWGEAWVALRDDIDCTDNPDVRVIDVRIGYEGDASPSSSAWQNTRLLGFPARGVRSDWRGIEQERTITLFSEAIGEQALVAGCRGPWSEGSELRSMLENIAAGLLPTAGTAETTFEDAGVSYRVDPTQVRVESGEFGATSVASMRETTLTTSWAPLAGRIFGPPPPLAEALEERFSTESLGWALNGSATDPVYGESGFGEVPALYGHVRRTDADGVEWDHVYMVGDTASRRLWVLVVAPVADAEAAAVMTGVLGTVLAK